MKQKIFDCVNFFKEDRQLELRFNILNNYVDMFVVCEGKQDHQGRRKNINFNIKKYQKFKKKIIHIICDEFPEDLNPWQRQAFQREFKFFLKRSSRLNIFFLIILILENFLEAYSV